MNDISDSAGKIIVIIRLIDGIASQVDAPAGKATGGSDDGVESVGYVSQLINELTVPAREQAQGMDQINKAVIHLDSVTQQNASLFEEIATASQSMVQRFVPLQRAVEVFKLSRFAA